MSTPLNETDIQAALGNLPGWEFHDDKLVRSFTFGSFKEALSFLVRVGLEAEIANHHPEITNVYNRVTLALNTHDAGGKVTQNDVDLAGAIQHFDWTA